MSSAEEEAIRKARRRKNKMNKKSDDADDWVSAIIMQAKVKAIPRPNKICKAVLGASSQVTWLEIVTRQT